MPKLLQALFDMPLKKLNVLVVDDNSHDGTGQIAENLKKTYKGRLDVNHRAGKLGLGSAYIQGFTQLLSGDSDAIGQMDADFSHEPAKVVELVEALEDCDAAIGSRYVPGGSLDKDWPIWRKSLSTFGNFYLVDLTFYKVPSAGVNLLDVFPNISDRVLFISLCRSILIQINNSFFVIYCPVTIRG